MTNDEELQNAQKLLSTWKSMMDNEDTVFISGLILAATVVARADIDRRLDEAHAVGFRDHARLFNAETEKKAQDYATQKEKERCAEIVEKKGLWPIYTSASEMQKGCAEKHNSVIKRIRDAILATNQDKTL